MELKDVQRKVQFRQGSYTVTIPLQIVHALGIRRNQYVRFAVSKNKVIMKPVESDITKKDIAEADKDSAALDKYDGPPEDAGGGDGGYMVDLAEALERKPDRGPSRMEKLRMK
ncbi:MAG: AbrB/MazE/SpoVT family DNA-binding domain-containing protein [Candidatus Poribacteria bacterium]|nr:AbrB/MazE/SpoVT family DNA-binding domain-containing protein [Candidatus Poribacteria bacterium]